MPDLELAALVGRRLSHRDADDAPESGVDALDPLPPRPARRPAVSSTRHGDRARDAGRPPQREHVQHDGPSWERARRNEAYPTISTRVGLGSLPGLPRIAVLAGALVIAAAALFFLPAFLGVGGKDAPTASPSASLAPPTATPGPTRVPEPTPQVYVVKEGDRLSLIAKAFGLTLDELLAANTETIKDPDRIAVGDEIIIPVPPLDEIPDGGPQPSPTG